MSITSRSNGTVSAAESSSSRGGDDEEHRPLTGEDKQKATTADDATTTIQQTRRWFWRRHLAVRCTLTVVVLALAQYGLQQAILYHEEQQKIPTGMTNRRGKGRKAVPWQKGAAFALPNSKEQTKIMEKNNAKFKKVFSPDHTITLSDLTDLQFTDDMPQQTWDEAAADRGPILDILHNAGLHVDVHVLQRLPTWTQVVEMYGDKPIILGKERCEAFREAIPAEHRYVGVAGQMNTGTNALAKYLANNIAITENTDHLGVLWTVPWYKHAWAALRYRYKYRKPDDHDTTLAVVTIREPYFWMQSMCTSPYTMEWNKSATHCPNLVEGTPAILSDGRPLFDNTTQTTPVRVRWTKDHIRKWPSMAHLWSTWYREYVDDADLPRLVIRFEDMLFHTVQVMDEIRTCLGAAWKHEEFVFQAAPAKTHPYFAKFKNAPSSLVSAMIKYGWDNRQRRVGSMTEYDQKFAHEVLDAGLLEQFHYPQPEV